MNLVTKGRINFSTLLEGFVKFNIVLLCIFLFLFYIKTLQVYDYFHFMKKQVILVFLTGIFTKCYEKIRYRVYFRDLSARKLSILKAALFSVIFIYFLALLLKYVSIKAEAFYLFLYYSALTIIYWFVIAILSRSHFMSKIIEFLKTCLEYKALLRLFLIFNLVFFVFISVILITISKNNDILETIFIILYFEISFLVFHIAAAYFIDFIWLSKDNKRNNKASLFGICVGSVLYVLKFNIIDKRLVGLPVAYDKFLLIAMISLVLFWIFFTLLFHLEWKNLLKRKN